MKKSLIAAAAALTLVSCGGNSMVVEHYYSTQEKSFSQEPLSADALGELTRTTLEILPAQTAQSVEGFGACFNELGWMSLMELTPEERTSIMQELFKPGVGANFNICRMPVAANDFARDWYSYNETEGDFAMENFSIENDKETLIPFIKAALAQNPEIAVWASPWSPPAWMKHNKHYASKSFIMEEKDIYGNDFGNGLPENRQGKEGTDMFIVEDAYLDAYGLYFEKFIEGYRAEGIEIFAVMPQNEFNSDQVFPSCCWTAKGITTFVGKYLGPRMERLGVDVMFGTMERPNYLLVDTVLQDPDASKYVKGVGFQWAGKDAIADVRKHYPEMRLLQTEQECGDGQNDWAGLLHSWELLKHYFDNGVSIYDYWNISLNEGGISRWGWRQNSLVVVDPATKKYRYTLEYDLMKHASGFVEVGAQYIATESADGVQALAFKNPNGDIVVIYVETEGKDRSIAMKVGGKTTDCLVKANSMNTFVIRG